MSEYDAVRDGTIDAMLRLCQSGQMEQIFREEVAPVVAKAMVDERIADLERQLADARAALQSIADSAADEEMDRLHREGTSWERIYEDRANDALKKIGGKR